MTVSVPSHSPDVLAGGLRIVVSEQGTTTMLALEGEWDLSQQEALGQAAGRALVRRPECLVLDLSRLSFLDSTGVHGAIELARCSERLSIRLVIVPAPREVQRIFELCHLTELLAFLPGREVS